MWRWRQRSGGVAICSGIRDSQEMEELRNGASLVAQKEAWLCQQLCVPVSPHLIPPSISLASRTMKGIDVCCFEVHIYGRLVSGSQHFVFCLSISGCPVLGLVREIILVETVLRADKCCG